LDTVHKFDFNDLEVSSDRHMKNGRYREALAIYFYIADGDPSLDAGYLAERIATCYRALGELHAAKYWYGRALEENPEVRASCADRIRELGDLDISSFVESLK
jgi:tetratricopeptide (TPR) repeat protein